MIHGNESAQTLAVCLRSTTRKVRVAARRTASIQRLASSLSVRVRGVQSLRSGAGVILADQENVSTCPHAFCVPRVTLTASHAMSFDPCTAHQTISDLPKR